VFDTRGCKKYGRSFILWSQSQAELQRGNHYFVNNAQFMHSKEAGISIIINTTKKHANKGLSRAARTMFSVCLKAHLSVASPIQYCCVQHLACKLDPE
jgi:hypothetical protein